MKHHCKQLNQKLTIEEAEKRKDLPCHGCAWSHQCKIPFVVALNIKTQGMKKCFEDFERTLNNSKSMTQLEGWREEDSKDE